MSPTGTKPETSAAAPGLFDILRDISAQEKTGTLEVRKGDVKSTVRFHRGRILFPSGETLAAFLVREGKLTREAIAEAKGEMGSTQDVIALLIQFGALTSDSAEKAALDFLDQFLSAVVTWSGEHFEFRQGDPDHPAYRSWGNTSCMSRILSVVRAAETPGSAIPLVEDPKAELSPIPFSGNPPSDLVLQPEEGFLLSRITGKCTVKDVVSVGPLGPEKTRKALSVLLAAGMVKGIAKSFPLYGRSPLENRGKPGSRKRKGAPRRGVRKSPAGKPPGKPKVATGIPSSATGLPPLAHTATSEDDSVELFRRIQTLEDQDHYQVLGLQASATEDQIRALYYDLARRFHPDRFQRSGDLTMAKQAEKLFSFVTEAYRVLTDPDERQRYDRYLNEKDRDQGPQVDNAHMARQNHRRGLELLQSGQLQKALQFLENAVNLDPKKDEYLCNLAEIQMKNPRLRQVARENLLKAIQMNPSRAETHVQLGLLLEREGQAEEAEKQYQEAISWEPAHTQAKRLLEKVRAKGPAGGRFRRLFRK